MTDQRMLSEPRPDADEIVRDDGDRRTTADPDAPAGDTAARREPNPLLREGADAPDAADIEDPDEQL